MAPSRAADASVMTSENGPYWTFEFFPPKTSVGYKNLVERLERMAQLRPAWVHITWGAGGSTQDRSLELAAAARKLGLDVCLHLTCTNMEKRLLDETLQHAKDLGIRKILALRGDEPRADEYFVTVDSQFQHAIDLVKYIKREHGDTFAIGVAGYPEGHVESSDLAKEVTYLQDKVDAGASFIVTQLFYDVDGFLKWYRSVRAAGITIPITPGIMPIQNYTTFRRMTTLCKCFVPEAISGVLTPIANDDQLVKDFGVDLAIHTMRKLYEAEPSITGFNLCTLNLEKSVRRILDGLGWTPPVEPKKKHAHVNGAGSTDLSTSQHLDARTQAWDEFPNGRFGDARSPAYGELDGWGVSLKLTPAEALGFWGTPTTVQHISDVFAAYMRGDISAIAWSAEPLHLETGAILNDLVSLNQSKGWWTVGSQPAVDGAPSTDPVLGFGPKGGYVYQKAFVEFFVPKSEIDALARRAEETNQKADARKVTFFAGGRSPNDFRTNMAKGEVNAVTWAAFPGQDLVTTTLIEEMSFKAWKEEAFDIWLEWARLYPAHSPSRKLIQQVMEDRWLVSIVHHDFKDERGLWEWLGLHGEPTV